MAGPGSETLAAGLAVFGMATSPFVYLSVNIWRTIHPLTTVVPTLPVDFALPLGTHSWDFCSYTSR